MMGWPLEFVYMVNDPMKKGATAMHDVTSKL